MLMAPPNYYKVLGVPRDADENAIKKAYRKGALKWRVPPLCCSARPPLHWRLTPRELCAELPPSEYSCFESAPTDQLIAAPHTSIRSLLARAAALPRRTEPLAVPHTQSQSQ